MHFRRLFWFYFEDCQWTHLLPINNISYFHHILKQNSTQQSFTARFMSLIYCFELNFALVLQWFIGIPKFNSALILNLRSYYKSLVFSFSFVSGMNFTKSLKTNKHRETIEPFAFKGSFGWHYVWCSREWFLRFLSFHHLCYRRHIGAMNEFQSSAVCVCARERESVGNRKDLMQAINRVQPRLII